MKLPAIGRKNFLFVGSENGGDRAAILLSVIASAKLCEVEPWAWLNAVFREQPLRFPHASSATDIVPRRVESSGDGGLVGSRYPAAILPNYLGKPRDAGRIGTF